MIHHSFTLDLILTGLSEGRHACCSISSFDLPYDCFPYREIGSPQNITVIIKDFVPSNIELTWSIAWKCPIVYNTDLDGKLIFGKSYKPNAQ